MNLFDLQREVGEWSRKNFPNNKPYMPLLGVGEETGELMHAHLKAEQGIRGTPEEHLAAKKDAVGDIAIYLADYCERNGLSFSECVTETWDQVKQRDWQKNQKDGVASNSTAKDAVRMRSLLSRAGEALVWMSGSPSFGDGVPGDAFRRDVLPLIKEICAALAPAPDGEKDKPTTEEKA